MSRYPQNDSYANQYSQSLCASGGCQEGSYAQQYQITPVGMSSQQRQHQPQLQQPTYRAPPSQQQQQQYFQQKQQMQQQLRPTTQQQQQYNQLRSVQQQAIQQQQAPPIVSKMGLIYYSNMCESSKKLLAYLTRTSTKDYFHYVCIDNRVKNADGQIVITLDNGQQVVLPPTIKSVPALIQLSSNKTVFGDDIYVCIPQQPAATVGAGMTTGHGGNPQQMSNTRQSVENSQEPGCFEFASGAVVSDSFGFLDNDFSAQGNGGMRDMHHYISPLDTAGSGQNFSQGSIPGISLTTGGGGDNNRSSGSNGTTIHSMPGVPAENYNKKRNEGTMSMESYTSQRDAELKNIFSSQTMGGRY